MQAILQCYIKNSELVETSQRKGSLFVVATPIGNLEDITLRALRILGDVDVVAAEDTRRSGNLLRHYDITTPLVSLHEHNELRRIPQLIDRLARGESIALVTDAGTPAVSDPGASLVRAVRAAGFAVFPVPGPSAVVTAMSVSGIEQPRFRFLGFPPIRSRDRLEWIADELLSAPEPTIVFEAPHRITRTLHDLSTILGNRQILAGREATKLHEEWVEGTASYLAARFVNPQGEFVLVISAMGSANGWVDPPSDSEIQHLFGQLTESKDDGRRETIKRVASRLGIPANQVYQALERAKKLGK